jgi:hypothetical protein
MLSLFTYLHDTAIFCLTVNLCCCLFHPFVVMAWNGLWSIVVVVVGQSCLAPSQSYHQGNTLGPCHLLRCSREGQGGRGRILLTATSMTTTTPSAVGVRSAGGGHTLLPRRKRTTHSHYDYLTGKELPSAQRQHQRAVSHDILVGSKLLIS